MSDEPGEVTPEEARRAQAALTQRARDLARARERGEVFPRTSPGKFDGFAPGIDAQGRPYPAPRRTGGTGGTGDTGDTGDTGATETP